jgi:hypothetical protein
MGSVVPRTLGFAGVHARSRHRSDSAASQGKLPGSEATNHLRQWPAVHCSRLQGVHSHLGNAARPNLALLSAIERKAGALAQVAEKRMHPAGDAVVTRRRETPDPTVCGSLQQRPAAQRDRLRNAEGYAHRSAGRDPAQRDRRLERLVGSANCDADGMYKKKRIGGAEFSVHSSLLRVPWELGRCR